MWKFEEPDTDDTVMLGGMDADGVQLVSGASLYKIIQRITFAQYPGPSPLPFPLAPLTTRAPSFSLNCPPTKNRSQFCNHLFVDLSALPLAA